MTPKRLRGSSKNDILSSNREPPSSARAIVELVGWTGRRRRVTFGCCPDNSSEKTWRASGNELQGYVKSFIQEHNQAHFRRGNLRRNIYADLT
jgi:hypothetical protein